MVSQITGVSIVCTTVSSGAGQRKHQSSASLDIVRGIHRWPVNSPHKGPVNVSIWWRHHGKLIPIPTSSTCTMAVSGLLGSGTTQVGGRRLAGSTVIVTWGKMITWWTFPLVQHYITICGKKQSNRLPHPQRIAHATWHFLCCLRQAINWPNSKLAERLMRN